MRKKKAEHENHERWLVSYADFITLLFAFFVVMFASSQTDKAKAQQFSNAVKDALDKGGVPAAVREVLGGTVDEKGKGNAQMKGPGGSNRIPKSETEARAAKEPQEATIAQLLPSMEFLSKELQDEIAKGKLQVKMSQRGLVVSLQQASFFPSGEDSIAQDTFGSLGKIAVTIKSLPNQVRLEGHTDSIPIHTARFRSNWELSASRGIAMMEILAERFGIPRAQMAIAGYADNAPVDTNDTEQGRARNRRVDIVILAKESLIAEPTAATKPPAAARAKH